MEKKKEIEKKYNEFQLLNNEVKDMHEQFMMLEQRFLELNTMKDGLKELNNKQMFVALGNDIFIDSEIKNEDSVLVNIGMGILIKKDVRNAKDMLDKQMKLVKETIDSVNPELKEKFSKLKVLQRAIRDLESTN